MIFKKIIIGIFISTLFHSYLFADVLNLRNIYDVKIFSTAKLEINDTNLIDEAHAKDLLKNVKELKAALDKESKKIIENNKNRVNPIFKGAAEEIFQDYARSVVYIGNRVKTRIKTQGSGFIVRHKGLKVITNWHVIDDAVDLEVYLYPDRMVNEEYLINSEDAYVAKLIKVDERKDLAMLEIDKLPFGIKPVNYGKFKDIKIGETLFAIGHPKGLLWSFTSGMVSQIRPNYSWRYLSTRHHANVIQTQTPINEGNSGGPLFNKEKELVGINTFTTDGENLNFAIAVDDLIEFINEKPKPIKKGESKYIKKKNKGPTWIKKKEKKSSDSDSVDLSGAKEADLNENGIIDSWLVDKNNNGIYEIAYGDSDEDGTIDIMAIDKNEDKNFEVMIFDKDGDGNPDLAEIDDNEDGETDVIAYDYNQDGEWDKFEKVG